MSNDQNADETQVVAHVGRLVLAQVLVLSVWFSASALIPALVAENAIEQANLAILATATQAGFVAGALFFAIMGLADRVDPRRLFAICAMAAGAINLALLILPPDGWMTVLSRLLVGAMLAGVYPVGLKIAVGWSLKRRGLLASLLVGALTLGSAMPQLITYLGGAEWRMVLVTTSILAFTGALVIMTCALGPHHARAAAFSIGDLADALRNRDVARAYLGYFGHMWELYAFWAWAPAAIVASGVLAHAGATSAPIAAGLAFVAMTAGALACVPCGLMADRFGKARIAQALLLASFVAALASTLAFAYAPALLIPCIIFWGIVIIPDSPLFSAMVADAAPASRAGSLMTLQTSLGFGLTILSVQATPWLASQASWSWALGILAVGPLLGAIALSTRTSVSKN